MSSDESTASARFSRDEPSRSGPRWRFGKRRTSTGGPGGRTLFREFSRGEPEAVASASATVSKVVQFRGYFIPHDERPDVIQEAMLDVIKAVKASGFSSDVEFCGFIRMVTHRRCVDWLRKKKNRERINPMVLAAFDPDQMLLAKERQELGTAVVSQLKEKCRTLFALHAGLGLTYGEIGELLGRTEGALRTQAYECLKEARVILGRLSGEPRCPSPRGE